MKRFTSFHFIRVFSLELPKWKYELRDPAFYELVFIEKGTGTHQLGGVSFAYKKGDLFLLAPKDLYEFSIETKTTFIFLKFQEQVFIEKSHWQETLKNALSDTESYKGGILFDRADRKNVHLLLKILLFEYQNRLLFSNEAVSGLFGAVMIILARNLNKGTDAACSASAKEAERLNSILLYIRNNALNKKKMNVQSIASHFGMSYNYMSIYVKKHTGFSIQQYIVQIKLGLAEKLLKQNRLNINEIAERLGYNDASHFNKMFKKYKHMTPSKFAK